MSKWFLSSPGELIFEHGEDAKEISVVWSPVEPSGAQWSPVEPRRRSVPPWMDPRKVAYAVGERMIKDDKGW